MSGSDKSSTPAPSNGGDKKKPLETKKELTEEDKKLKSNLETLVNVIKESSEKLHLNPTLNNNDPNNEIIILSRNALETLRKEIRSSTGSMTALPKPLKFLRPHFAELFNIFNNLPINSNKILLAEILSVLCMSIIFSSNEKNLSLKLKLIARRLNKKLSLKNEDIGEWGHEYVRHLAGEIGKEFQSKTEKAAEEGEKKEKSIADSSSSSTTTTTTDESGGEEKKIEEKKVDKEAIKYILKDDSELLLDELIELVDEIIPFFLKHNAEFDAVDLLLETEQIDKILQTSYFTTDNSDRICKYLLKCVDYIVDPEEQTKIYNVAYQIYLKFSFFADALRVAIKISDKEKMLLCFQSCESDRLMQKQLGFILGSQKIVLEQLKDDEELMQCIGNVQLSSFYQHLAADLDVKEPKSVEDITKPHLEGEGSRRNIRAQPTAQSGVDSAKQNLAATFINAFVNAGFGKDLLLTPEGSEWLYKNKSHGMLSAAASLGMIMLWDVESGFSAVDRYSFSRESFIKAGSALAHGILSSGVTSEMDAAQALLAEHLESKDNDLKVSAILGLGFAYAGTEREDVLEMLVPILVQEGQSMEVVSSVCLALGLVFCGTANDGISGNIVVAFMDRSDTDLKDSTARMMCLGMGLLFLGKGDTVDGALNAIKAIEHPISKYLSVVVESCAYAGSSSVLQIQKLLNVCSEHLSQDEEEEKKEPLKMIHQEAAILGIAAVAMGEELGQEMALRAIDHILQYCEVNIRRVVPFALSLLSLSHPRIGVVDTLTKLSHDQDQQVSQNAVLSLGFVGAGTNNSRIAGQLRNLASYYNKEPNHLFLIRLAQGLLHMGKGLLTINPISSDGFLLNKVALSGLLISLHGALDLKNTYLNKRHYLLYSLVTAIRPRMLMILDENLKPIPVPVRVGQKVDTVGAAGKPKTITGFQTHTTPVLISAGERAELANEEYIPLSNVLEGFVIVKKNPNYIDEQK